MGQVSDCHASSGDPEVAAAPSWMTAVRRAVENNLAEAADGRDDEQRSTSEPDDDHHVHASDVKRLRAKRAGRRTLRDPSAPAVSRPLRLDR